MAAGCWLDKETVAHRVTAASTATLVYTVDAGFKAQLLSLLVAHGTAGVVTVWADTSGAGTYDNTTRIAVLDSGQQTLDFGGYTLPAGTKIAFAGTQTETRISLTYRRKPT